MIDRLKRVPVLALGLVASACSPLLVFNAVMPKDGGVRVAARDIPYGADHRQQLDVYVPSGPTAGPRPIIVFFYGGSWNSGVKNGYGFVGRALAARGFVVAIPDYRLVPQVRFPAFLEDGAAAVRWMRGHAAQYGGDPDRVVLAGHSAGAYNAARRTGGRSGVRPGAGQAGDPAGHFRRRRLPPGVPGDRRQGHAGAAFEQRFAGGQAAGGGGGGGTARLPGGRPCRADHGAGSAAARQGGGAGGDDRVCPAGYRPGASSG
jgi:hypothetical protein